MVALMYKLNQQLLYFDRRVIGCAGEYAQELHRKKQPHACNEDAQHAVFEGARRTDSVVSTATCAPPRTCKPSTCRLPQELGRPCHKPSSSCAHSHPLPCRCAAWCSPEHNLVYKASQPAHKLPDGGHKDLVDGHISNCAQRKGESMAKTSEQHNAEEVRWDGRPSVRGSHHQRCPCSRTNLRPDQCAPRNNSARESPSTCVYASNCHPLVPGLQAPMLEVARRVQGCPMTVGRTPPFRQLCSALGNSLEGYCVSHVGWL